MLWVEKYRPKTFNEVLGNAKAKKEIENWISNWKEGIPQKPLLLVGPPGTGKTTMAHLIAKQFSDVIELNASDKRSYDVIMNTVGEASTTKTLFKQKTERDLKIIILDEVDGIHGTKDHGGTRAINKIIKEGRHPLVLAANDFYSKRLTSIKTKTQTIKIPKLRSNSIGAFLKKICHNEEIKFDEDVIKELAKRSNGDLRSAINDLQIMAQTKKHITVEDIEIIGIKDSRSTIFDAVRTVLKSKSIDKIKQALILDEDPTLVLEFIAENVPKEYENPKEIQKAYNMISLADLNFGRARSSRHYGYWKYSNNFMGLGVALSKKETYRKFAKYSGPSSFSLMGRTRGKREVRNRIAEKMKEKLHISNYEAIEQFPYIEIMFSNDKIAYEISSYLDLDDDEIKVFRKKKIPKKIIKEGMMKKSKERKEITMNEDSSLNIKNFVSKNKIKKEIKDETIDNTKSKTKTENKKKSKQTTLFDF